MAEYRRSQLTQVSDPGFGRAVAQSNRGLRDIADVVARREQRVIKDRAEKAQREGMAEGTTAAREGRAPVEREANPIISAVFGKPISTEAYNKGLESGYLAAAESDARIKMTELRLMHKDDSEAFREAVETYKTSLAETVPDGLKPFVDQAIHESSQSALLHVRKAEIEKGRNTGRANLTVGLESNMDAIANALRDGNDEVAENLRAKRKQWIQDGVTSGLLDESEAILLEAETDEAYAIETVKGIVFQAYHGAPQGEGMKAAAEAIDALDSVSNELLSPSERKAARAEILAELNQEEAIRKARTETTASEMLMEFQRLQVRKLKGENVADEVEMFGEKWGSTEKGGAKYVELLRAVKDEREGAAELALVQKAISGAAPLSPDDADHRRAVDNYFQKVLLPSLPNDGTAGDLITDFVTSVGIVPQMLISTITGQLTNPQTAAQGVVLLDGLQRAAPSAVNQIPEKRLRDGLMMKSLMDAGVPEEDAVSQVLDLKNTDANMVKARREAYALIHEEDVKGPLSDRLDTEDGVFSRMADVPPGMAAQYLTIAENEYARTGDLEESKAMADRLIKGRWAVVEREGKRVWKQNPPELHYGVPNLSPEDNSAWILEQAAKDVGRKPEEIRLTPAARKVGRDGRPIYIVSAVVDGSYLDAAPGEYFIPDFNSSPYYEKLQERAKRREREAINNAERTRRVQGLNQYGFGRAL